jgi:hypothetical protein
VSVLAIARWAERRWEQTSDFYESENEDSSKFNDGDWLGPSGATVVVSTHDPEVVAIGDHVIVMRDGAIQSETVAGQEVGVIDDTGRIQLPAQVLEWYPTRRVIIDVNEDDQSIRITRP